MKEEIQSLLDRMEQGGDWHAYRREIAALHGRATTEDEHVALLQAHKALVEVAKHCFDGESYAKLLPAAEAEYRMFLAKEATESGLVNPVLFDQITRREVRSGRLDLDDDFRKLAAAGASVLGDSNGNAAHSFRPGNWFFYGIGIASILAVALARLDVSPIWMIPLGLVGGWYFNERERKRVDVSVVAPEQER
ncbi:hypothetical protein [Burkholderia diffusa]|uniref:hypothetical protein n=1 Tax=Burkholderia diffusa TaxID=488732 RepID=UPI001583F5DC|nr:hypothetical protein [Burkholderia diffusa]